MPSPVGHALAGMAVGWAIAGHPLAGHATVLKPWPGGSTSAGRPVTGRTVEAALFGMMAAAPDLDLVAGGHSMYTHSLGAVLVVLVGARLLLGPGRWRLAFALAAAYGSHILLDWLGSDTSPPIGILALWPFSHEYYQSSLNLFDAISRRYWLPHEFIVGNLSAAAKEVAILGPLAWMANWWAGKLERRARPN